MRTAAVYLRVSSANQEDNYSLDSQEAACRRYAAERGYQIDETRVYREVHTGVELWERPRLAALREVVRRRDVNVVVAHSVDRLSRDPVHLSLLITEADHAGVLVAFVTEPLDTWQDGGSSRLARGYAAQVEYVETSERLWRGRVARARSGKPLSNPWPPYGYRWNHDKSGYVADPITSRIVQRIFNEARAGVSLRKIVNGINADQIPTVKGGRHWHPSTVYEILKRRFYIGEVVALRWRTVKEGGIIRRYERPQDEQIKLPAGTAPALIDAETFEIVQARLVRNKQIASRYNRYPEAALLRGGFAKCGYCGRTLVVCNRGSTYGCESGLLGRCAGHRIAIKVLDGAVWGHVTKMLTHPERIRRHVAQLRENDPTEGDMAAVDRSLEQVARQQANVSNAIALLEGDVLTPLVEKLSVLSAQRRQLDAERAAIMERRAGWEAAQQRLDDLERWCEGTAQELDELDYAGRRRVIAALGIGAKAFHRRHEPRFEVTAAIPLSTEIVSEDIGPGGCAGPGA